jgi:Domain of unknown function DUF11
VQTADVGHRVRGVTIASNTGGAATANSAPTIVVPAPPPPSNTTLPSITGTVQVGQTLTGAAGTWTGAGTLSYTYEWRRCDSLGANCTAISGATSTTYAVTGLDAGSTLRFAATAANGGGSTTAVSAQTVLVPGGGTGGTAPVAVVPPTISGTFQVGQTVTALPGTWSGTSPITYVYAWQRCDATGGACNPIPGATTTSYLVVSADAGLTLRFAVAATNGAGTVNATSAPSGIVTLSAAAPVVGTQPTVSGTAQVGQALTGSPGTWSGTGPISYAYAWQRCDAGGASCVAITGATGLTYTVATADADSTLRFAVTATNAAGSVTATSSSSGLVPAPSSGGGSGGSGSGGGGGSGGATPPDLAVSFYATPTPTAAGATLNYYVTVANSAIQGATGVYLDFTLPANVTVIQTFADRGPGCIGDNNVVTCPLDFVPAKTSATVTLTVKVNANGALAASASVREIESDANPSNNTASGTIEAGAPAKTTNAVPTGLNGDGKTTASRADKVRPTVAALSNHATHGQRAALRFKVYDDRGVARVTGTVKNGGRVLATLKTGFGPVVDKSVYYLSWNVPATLSGNLAFCVVAADRAGNTSKSSCAPLSVR